MADPTKRTGTIEPYRDASGKQRYRGRIRLGDGARRSIDVDERYCYSEERAREYVAAAQEREDRTGQLLADKVKRAAAKVTASAEPTSSKGETCDAWFGRYQSYQRECGQTDPTKGTRWDKWISKRIGHKAPDAVTRSEIEDIRDDLDAAIAAWMRDGKGEGRISGKTAMNVWSALTSSFRAMTSCKRRDLRVLADRPNPCVGVEPPGDRNSRKARRKTFLFPKEAAAVLACEALALEWRELHAIAGYTYLRPGELRVLTWEDVSLDDGLINVTKAWDYNEEEIKPPKTRNGVRRVPIEPALMPLLRRMRKGRKSTDLVVPVLSSFGEDHLAELFREHLTLAGVTRADLHRSTATHVQANFRSWRDSGLTWLAMAGLGVDKIMRRAGHDMVQTTMGYVKLAEDLTGDLGTPFAPLPASLVDGEATAEATQGTQPKPVTPWNETEIVEREKGFEPSTSTLARWHSTTELLPQLTPRRRHETHS